MPLGTSLASASDGSERAGQLYFPRPMTDPGLALAAQVLVQTALKLRAGERLVIVEDAASVLLGDAIATAAEASGAWVKRCAPRPAGSAGGSGRPHKVMPDLLLLALHDADASVFIASPLPAELPMRQALLHVVRQRRLRHAHMPGLARGPVRGRDAPRLRADRASRQAGARSPRGRESDRHREPRRHVAPDRARAGRSVVRAAGGARAGRWGNFPAGAIYTSPANRQRRLRGRRIARGVLRRARGNSPGQPGAAPRRRGTGGRRRGAFAAAEARHRGHAAISPNSDRVGLVSIGVNPGLDSPVGDALVDQNLPGLHIGIGDPAATATGATWSAPTCFAACQAASRVAVDGEVVVESGRVVLASRRRMPAVRVSTPAPGGG